MYPCMLLGNAPQFIITSEKKKISIYAVGSAALM